MSALPIVVLGAGPAGLAAAHAASATGQQVVIVDENVGPGGQIWRGGAPGWRDRRADALWTQLQARAHVRYLFGTRLVARAGPGALLLDTASGPQTLHWERAIVCSGARELLLPFPGWPLPGVTGAGGMQALLKGGMPIAGKRVVVAGTGPLLLAVADLLRRRGAVVAAIVEHRDQGDLLRFGAALALSHQRKFAQALALFASLRGIPYLRGALVVSANGEATLGSVSVAHQGRVTEIACDFAACGYGLVPSLEVATLFGCVSEAGRVTVGHHQQTSVAHVWAAGESTGIGGVDKALAEGAIAGLSASGQPATLSHQRARASAQAFAALLARSFAPRTELAALCTDTTIVCRCEDVRAAALLPHNSWRLAKLQTRVGMGPCQGRVCGAACRFLYGWDSGGACTILSPVSAATLACAAEPT